MNKKAILKMLCLGVIFSIAVSGCSGEGNASGSQNVAVQSVADLAGLNSGLLDRYAGVVVSQETLEFKQEENKTIKEIFVSAGDEVSEGQPLFTYDTEEISLSIEQAKLELEKLQNSITTMNSQIISLEKDKKSASSSDKLSYTIEIQTLQADIKQAEYNINAKSVEITRLEKSLENAEVTSTVSGVVQSINENGEIDNYGNALPFMTVMQTGEYRVKGTVNEQNVYNLMEGTNVIIRSRIDENQTWTGVIDKVDLENPETDNNNNGYMVYSSSSSDSMTQSSKYPFYVTLDNSDALMMGQHIYIEPDLGQTNHRDGIWLSSYYIVQEGDKAYVWAADSKDCLEKRSVTLGQKDEVTDEYEIVEGLAGSDYIAIPEEGLKEGQSVTKYDSNSMGTGSVEGGMTAIPGDGEVDVMFPEDGDGVLIPEDGWEDDGQIVTDDEMGDDAQVTPGDGMGDDGQIMPREDEGGSLADPVDETEAGV